MPEPEKNEEEIGTSDFPRLSIFLKDVSLEEIDNNGKNMKYPGNTAVFTVNNEEYSFEDVEIKGRGNSTWSSNKKPYQIKFKDKINLFGLGKAKNWILLANAYDITHLRNEMAYYLAEMLDEEYRIEGEFVELFIDNDYRGLYYLTHKVEISSGSVNLKDEKGVLAEVDTIHLQGAGDFTSSASQILDFKDFVSGDEDKQAEAKAEFIENFNNLEKFAEEKKWGKIVDLIDAKSFINYYLISDFTDNVDAYGTSHFFYKNGSSGKIHAGPAWDFDLAFGNANWAQTMSPIFEGLIEIPEFQEAVRKLYEEKLSGKLEEYLAHLDEKTAEIREAALRSDEMWETGSNFDEAVEGLKNWVVERFGYLEEKYGK